MKCLLRALQVVIARDLLIYWRKRAEWLASPLFFIVVASLFPIALGPDPKTLSRIAAGIIWVAVLLAVMLSLESVLRQDYEDGCLEQWLMTSYPLPCLVLAKAGAHWLALGFSLLVLSPILGVWLNLSLDGIVALFLSLALGLPILSLMGLMGVALTLSLHRGGVLLAVLVLPLYVPVLIFGTSAVAQGAEGLPFGGQLALLGALLILALLLTPFLIAAALKVSLTA